MYRRDFTFAPCINPNKWLGQKNLETTLVNNKVRLKNKDSCFYKCTRAFFLDWLIFGCGEIWGRFVRAHLRNPAKRAQTGLAAEINLPETLGPRLYY